VREVNRTAGEAGPRKANGAVIGFVGRSAARRFRNGGCNRREHDSTAWTDCCACLPQRPGIPFRQCNDFFRRRGLHNDVQPEELEGKQREPKARDAENGGMFPWRRVAWDR